MKPEVKQVTYSLLNPVKITAPIVKISKIALKWIASIADLHDHEVGIWGFVDEPAPNTYFIKEIFYPKHSEAAGATCEISPEGETLMAEWLISHNREDDIGKCRFWGHSHVNMGVFASGQDETQALQRMNQTQSYLIRGIFNKAGLLSISFFDYTNQRRFDNIQWETDVDDEDKVIRDKINELKILNLPVNKGYAPTGTYDDYSADTWNERRGYGYGNGDYTTPPLNETDKTGLIRFPQNNNKKFGKRKNKHSYVYEFSRK